MFFDASNQWDAASIYVLGGQRERLQNLYIKLGGEVICPVSSNLSSQAFNVERPYPLSLLATSGRALDQAFFGRLPWEFINRLRDFPMKSFVYTLQSSSAGNGVDNESSFKFKFYTGVCLFDPPWSSQLSFLVRPKVEWLTPSSSDWLIIALREFTYVVAIWLYPYRINFLLITAITF